MSAFQHWSFRAHDLIKAAGLKIKYGQVRQLLARGLGHRDVFSFDRSESEAFERACIAVFAETELLARAKELGLEIQRELLDELFTRLLLEPGLPALTRHSQLPFAARRALSTENRLIADLFSQEFSKLLPQHSDVRVQVHSAEADEGFRDGLPLECSVHGTAMTLLNGEDFDVSFAARIEFPSIGRRLLAFPIIHQLETSGLPEAWDPNYSNDFAYISDSDS